MAKEIIRCPHCGAAYRVTEQMKQREGKNARCASCKEIFTIELSGEEDTLPPPTMSFEVIAAKASAAQKTPSKESPENESESRAAEKPAGETTAETSPGEEPQPAAEKITKIAAEEKRESLAEESETASPEETPEPKREGLRLTPTKPDDESMPRPPSSPSDHLEIPVAEKKKSRDFRVTGRRLAGSLIMLLLLVAQVVWMFRGDEKVYPLLEQACEQLNCSLPEMRDTTRLSVTNRLFSAVENKPGAYRLQLHIANKAPFPQPYPIIEISLIDSRGIVRARKKLSPDEYLEEYQPDERLAAKTKTEIGFMIYSPATETTGFELEFL